MVSHIETGVRPKVQLSSGEWIKLGAVTAVVAIGAVLAVQAVAVALWPEIALFAPLDSYLRSALFTLVPVIGATALFAWLANRYEYPRQRFITVSVIVLLISIIPDYILPVPNRTVLASSVAAFLHVIAAIATVGMLVSGYEQRVR